MPLAPPVSLLCVGPEGQRSLLGPGVTLGFNSSQTDCMDLFFPQSPREVSNFTWSHTGGECVRIMIARMTVIRCLLYVRQLGKAAPSGMFRAQ